MARQSNTHNIRAETPSTDLKTMMVMLQQIMQQVMTSFSKSQAQVCTGGCEAINICLWNANGLSKLNKINILLISETHFTKKHHFSINWFKSDHASRL